MPNDEAVSYLASGEGEAILVMSDLVTVKASRADNGGEFGVTEVSTPPQGGPPMLHRHPDQETFYVVAGLYRFDTMEGDQPASMEATTGAVIRIPSMVWHNYKNIGTVRGTLIAILQPGDMIDFFRELGVPVTDKTNPPRPSGPPDMERLAMLMQKHHIEVLRVPVPS